MVLGVIYTFFFSNNKTLSTTEIRLQLQTEAEAMEKILFNLGTQSNGIEVIDGQVSDHESNIYKKLPLGDSENNKYKREINEVILTYDNGEKAILLIQDQSFSITIKDKKGQVIKQLEDISENIECFKIRPLDVRMVDTLEEASFKDSPGLEFEIKLAKKKGYSDVEYNVSTIVKFRNK